MLRTVWLAIFCLAAIGGVAVIRSIVGSSSASRALPAAISADISEDTPALPKGDRLPSRFFDRTVPASTPAVATINPAVVPIKAAPAEAPKQPPAKDDIVSWHWHQGSKIVRRRKSP
jgi:hypothetical protein